jgi:hypothetical protein
MKSDHYILVNWNSGINFEWPLTVLNHKFDFDEKFVKSKKINTHGKIRIHLKLLKVWQESIRVQIVF